MQPQTPIYKIIDVRNSMAYVEYFNGATGFTRLANTSHEQREDYRNRKAQEIAQMNQLRTQSA